MSHLQTYPLFLNWIRRWSMSTFTFLASQVRYLEEHSNACQEEGDFLPNSFHDSSLAKLPGQACEEFPVTRKGSPRKIHFSHVSLGAVAWASWSFWTFFTEVWALCLGELNCVKCSHSLVQIASASAFCCSSFLHSKRYFIPFSA